jgi:DNA-binding MarR family transcriptional regulator
MANPASLPDVHAAVACLGRLTELFRQRRQQLAASVGLTEQQWSVLDEIENEHFMPSMFARRRESSAAAVSKILRQLQDKELVVVSLSTSDGRQRNYELSPLGKRALDRLRAHRQHAISEVWLELDATELAAFTRFGNELTERLERYSDEHDFNALEDGESSPPDNTPTGNRPSDKASPAAQRGSGNGKDTLRQGV